MFLLRGYKKAVETSALITTIVMFNYRIAMTSVWSNRGRVLQLFKNYITCIQFTQDRECSNQCTTTWKPFRKIINYNSVHL